MQKRSLLNILMKINILLYLIFLIDYRPCFQWICRAGAFLVYQIKKPLIRISKPEIINNIILYFDNTIRKGIFDIKPARTAPAPIATNKDGKAQQSNVPRLVNKLEMEQLNSLMI